MSVGFGSTTVEILIQFETHNYKSPINIYNSRNSYSVWNLSILLRGTPSTTVEILIQFETAKAQQSVETSTTVEILIQFETPVPRTARGIYNSRNSYSVWNIKILIHNQNLQQ